MLDGLGVSAIFVERGTATPFRLRLGPNVPAQRS
jgi:hypothetical protein